MGGGVKESNTRRKVPGKKLSFVRVVGKLTLEECRAGLQRANKKALKEIRTSLKWMIKEKETWEVIIYMNALRKQNSILERRPI
eukprot:758400-Prorocentrum_lima.AAC.1